jgi:uncharacterized protein YgbK (DUF1537 family)
MLLGVIADDFTGAGDIANTLAKGVAHGAGLKTLQFLGVPAGRAPADCEAGVVSLKSRSAPVHEAVTQSLAALEWLREQGCRQFFFKYCSTFDSTPDGNIGPVGEALAAALASKGVVACPAFPEVGRTIYQGHLFVFDKLLNESGLEHHPLNPMTDADIRRWLARQSAKAVGHVPWSTVRNGAGPISAALAAAADRGEVLVIVDALRDEDLLAIAEACVNAKLVSGGSGVAIGLPRNFIRRGLAPGRATEFRGVTGPAAILAGSCSRATRAQVEHHSRQHPVLRLKIEALLLGTLTPADVAGFVRGHAQRLPLVASSAAPDEVDAHQRRFGREHVARTLERFFGELARLVVADGVRRLVVAGGETAGAAAAALSLQALTIGPEIDPGVPVLEAEREGIALALKSGNFGSPDFFEKAIRILGGER